MWKTALALNIAKHAGVEDQKRVLVSTCGLNPGDSGGPLVNLRGEAIGINSMGLGRAQGLAGVGRFFLGEDGTLYELVGPG